jgi:hypothetical protein
MAEILISYTLYKVDEEHLLKTGNQVQTSRKFYGSVKELIERIKGLPMNHFQILNLNATGKQIEELGKVISECEELGKPYSNCMY